MYQDDMEEYETTINHSWLDKPRKGASKLSKNLVRAYFKEDIGDMIVLLNRIIDNPQGAPFEPWMYYFINEIMNGVKMIDRAQIISNNLDNQLRNLEGDRIFYMSSYLFYSLARTYRLLPSIFSLALCLSRPQITSVYSVLPCIILSFCLVEVFLELEPVD